MFSGVVTLTSHKSRVSPTVKNLAKAVLIVVLVALILGIVYWENEVQRAQINPRNTSNPTSTPSSSKTGGTSSQPTSSPSALPAANVTSDLSYAENSNGSLNGDFLLINGTVTNDSPNGALDVGIRVTAMESTSGYSGTAINETVPVISSIYPSDFSLGKMNTALTPLIPAHQSANVTIELYPYVQSETPTLYDINVTVIWSNS